MKRFCKEASSKDAIAWGYPDQCQAFTSGVTAFLVQDPEVVAICQEQMNKGTWGMIQAALQGIPTELYEADENSEKAKKVKPR